MERCSILNPPPTLRPTWSQGVGSIQGWASNPTPSNPIMSALPTIRPTQAGVFPVVTPGIHQVALGNGTQVRVAVYPSGETSLFVGLPGEGCWLFQNAPHPTYVREKMGLMEGDAENLADFIACQFGEAPQPFGHYNPQLCA